MKKCALLLLLALSLIARELRADQFSLNPRETCTNALSFCPAGSIVVSFCSLCDGEHVEVWQVKEALVSDAQFRDLFELRLFVKKLYRSKEAFTSNHFRAPAHFEKIRGGEQSLSLEDTDLAYLYVLKPDGAFHVLAAEMGLTPLDCLVPTITLPRSIMKSATAKTLPAPAR